MLSRASRSSREISFPIKEKLILPSEGKPSHEQLYLQTMSEQVEETRTN